MFELDKAFSEKFANSSVRELFDTPLLQKRVLLADNNNNICPRSDGKENRRLGSTNVSQSALVE
jgi:hypothetical protein